VAAPGPEHDLQSILREGTHVAQQAADAHQPGPVRADELRELPRPEPLVECVAAVVLALGRLPVEQPHNAAARSDARVPARTSTPASQRVIPSKGTSQPSPSKNRSRSTRNRWSSACELT